MSKEIRIREKGTSRKSQLDSSEAKLSALADGLDDITTIFIRKVAYGDHWYPENREISALTRDSGPSGVSSVMSNLWQSRVLATLDYNEWVDSDARTFLECRAKQGKPITSIIPEIVAQPSYEVFAGSMIALAQFEVLKMGGMLSTSTLTQGAVAVFYDESRYPPVLKEMEERYLPEELINREVTCLSSGQNPAQLLASEIGLTYERYLVDHALNFLARESEPARGETWQKILATLRGYPATKYIYEALRNSGERELRLQEQEAFDKVLLTQGVVC